MIKKSIKPQLDLVLVRSLENSEIQDLCVQLSDLLDQSEGEKI